MSALKRAFLAVVPPAEVLDAIDGLFDRTGRSKLQWTRRDQWHLTVQYFGKVADDDALVGTLAGALDSVAAPTVQVRGAGGFPSARRAVVFWLGVADGDPLRAVHRAVAEAAGEFIRPRDLAPFVPHLTLARLKNASKIVDEVDALADVGVGSPWTVDEVVLLESEPGRGGSTYRRIAGFTLT
ncbi:MAG: RNA 2',3'-cyclic phosphodiesterase [Acidimicrobiia bacterium]|nr:RNA 2',3'-cyclic phosphodiesterase [Acidimicrobiia bacterium]